MMGLTRAQRIALRCEENCALCVCCRTWFLIVGTAVWIAGMVFIAGDQYRVRLNVPLNAVYAMLGVGLFLMLLGVTAWCLFLFAKAIELSSKSQAEAVKPRPSPRPSTDEILSPSSRDETAQQSLNVVSTIDAPYDILPTQPNERMGHPDAAWSIQSQASSRSAVDRHRDFDTMTDYHPEAEEESINSNGSAQNTLDNSLDRSLESAGSLEGLVGLERAGSPDTDGGLDGVSIASEVPTVYGSMTQSRRSSASVYIVSEVTYI